MELMQERYKRIPGKPSLDGYAIAKGWFVTVGLWLLGSFIALFITELLPFDGSGSVSGYIWGTWAYFSVLSFLIAAVLGLPLALLLDRLMRSIQIPWIHVAAFAVFFTLAGALLTSGITDGFWNNFFGISGWLGLCAAIGRISAFRRAGAFRKPTTWA